METTGGGTADVEFQQQLTRRDAPKSTGRRKVPKAVSDSRIGPDPQAAAFFDLDNTMIQGASMFYLAKGLYRRNIFPRKTILRALWLQLQFRFIGGENPDHIAEAQASSLSLITGLSVEKITSVCEEIYDDTIAPRIWPGTRAIAQLHLDAGHQVWLVTAAPQEIAELIASRLGISGALGTRAAVVDGCYTGQLERELMHGPAKAAAVLDLAGLYGFDLARSFAYSDSHNDLPLLSVVGHPCAVNPDTELLDHAEQQDWQIRDYRTGRKAMKAGAVGVGTLGVSTGALLLGLAIRRRRQI
ncbi:MAG: HAD-IB family hydrolase [Microlunatus sp.]